MFHLVIITDVTAKYKQPVSLLTWYSLKRQETTEPVVDLERPTWQFRMTGALNLVP